MSRMKHLCRGIYFRVLEGVLQLISCLVSIVAHLFCFMCCVLCVVCLRPKAPGSLRVLDIYRARVSQRVREIWRAGVSEL